jgi:hypothetical protein
MRRRKSEINAEIATLIGVTPPHMSTGSTESKRLFELINEILGLGIPQKLTKPELARAIVESAGATWAADCESRGSTVTAAGMQRVLDAVRLFVGTRQVQQAARPPDRGN